MLAFLGGTGPEGKGLAMRLAIAGESIVIGSRDGDRAAATAAELRGMIDGHVSPGTFGAPALALSIFFRFALVCDI